MSFAKQLAHRTIAAASLQRRLLSSSAPKEVFAKPHQTKNRLGPNAVVGGMVFSFVGGVYYYTVYMLRKQGNELMDELDDLEKEIESEAK